MTWNEDYDADDETEDLDTPWHEDYWATFPNDRRYTRPDYCKKSVFDKKRNPALRGVGCCLVCPPIWKRQHTFPNSNGSDGCLCRKCKCRKCSWYISKYPEIGGYCNLIRESPEAVNWLLKELGRVV